MNLQINPRSIKPLSHYIVSGLMDKLRRDSDSDFWFNPEFFESKLSDLETSLRSFRKLKKHHKKQIVIRNNRIR
jgi:hypothetical protein